MHLRTLIFIIGVLAGVIIGESSSFGSEIAVLAILISIIQGAIYFFERKNVKTEKLYLCLFTILISIGLFTGIIREQLSVQKDNFTCAACTFTAKVISTPEVKDTYQVFNIHPEVNNKNIYDVEVKTPLYPKYKAGDRLQISGKVSEPKAILPHNDSNSFDYVSYLKTKNVGSEMFYPKVEILPSDGITFQERLISLKESLISKLETYVSAPASSLASGMLFGKSSMPIELTNTFRIAGLSHIIVLSGFNIAVVISFILFIFAFIPLTLRIIFAGSAVVIFILAVGGEASVVRATIMAFIGLLATLIGKEYVAKQALIISLLLIVMYEPYSLLHDVSLHLSFLATAGIIYLSPVFQIIFNKIKSESFRSLITTTLSAYIATLPYILFTFGKISMYALLSNVIALPLVPATMLLSFLVIVSSYIWGGFGVLFGFVTTILANVIIWVAQVTEKMPYSYIPLQINFYSMIMLYILIVLTLTYVYKKKNNKENETLQTENVLISGVIAYSTVENRE
ncbi:MAG: internalization-related competence protein ComEC/Rec2, competence protein ComEC protein [Candidatus Nomurabacteria bacterium]|nr:internalization-related competence protein ComEC/Rec2, competence protein ComEC protein [Candidatus Nomurabacteria bacterium]